MLWRDVAGLFLNMECGQLVSGYPKLHESLNPQAP